MQAFPVNRGDDRIRTGEPALSTTYTYDDLTDGDKIGTSRSPGPGAWFFAAVAAGLALVFSPLALAAINPVVADDPGGGPCSDGDWFRDARGDAYFCIRGVWVWLGQ